MDNASCGSLMAGVDMPARFVADRVFVDVRIAGELLIFYTDTGGDNLLRKCAADRLGLPRTPVHEGPDAGVTRLPPFERSVPAVDHEIGVVTDLPEEGWDGQLGARWMAECIDGAIGGTALRHLVVTLDYPGSRACFRRPSA